MRGYMAEILAGSLLLAGSLTAGAPAHGPWYGGSSGERYNVLIPGIGTGCFGETLPVLMMVPGGEPAWGGAGGFAGGWSGPADNLPGSMAPANGPSLPPTTMPPADEKATEGDGLTQLTSRSGRAAGPAREAEVGAKVRRGSGAIDLRGLAAKDAEPMFWKGYRLYWDGQHAEALPLFEAATQLQDQDARFWYFRSLTEAALGQAKKAEESARQGADLQLRGLPSQGAISQALERVQGEPRATLRRALDARRAAR
ncbi:MAG: hypothetical protein U0797_11865 [Gemmataceae bacterium]